MLTCRWAVLVRSALDCRNQPAATSQKAGADEAPVGNSPALIIPSHQAGMGGLHMQMSCQQACRRARELAGRQAGAAAHQAMYMTWNARPARLFIMSLRMGSCRGETGQGAQRARAGQGRGAMGGQTAASCSSRDLRLSEWL